jgi:sugar/nucleoside kinase (ribokinase family)
MNKLTSISEFSKIGKTILGLNENEALKVYTAITGKDSISGKLMDAAREIFSHISVTQLLIHPVDRCLLISNDQQLEMKGRVVTHPTILTGGGDNLNAGFCFGLLHGFADDECVLLGMAASGAYVQNGVSPTHHDLIGYLNTF